MVQKHSSALSSRSMPWYRAVLVITLASLGVLRAITLPPLPCTLSTHAKP